VISNVDPFQTFGKMIGFEKVSMKYKNKISKIQPSLASVQAYAVVNANMQQDYNEFDHEIFINDSYDLEKSYEDVLTGDYKRMPLGVTIYENIYPEYQGNPNKSTLSLFQLCHYDDWKGLEKEEYLQKKKEVIAIMLERLEDLFPDISSKIEYIELSTPLTNERYTNNLNGAIYGAAQTVKQAMHRRLSQFTPIEGLYLAGSWTRPGHGYSGVISSGYNLATQLVKMRTKDEADVIK
jgi:phytoene dehydrogenase-like protein